MRRTHYPQDPSADAQAERRENYGNLIRYHRQLLNCSQAELASMLFVDRNTVANWEGGRSRPDLDILPHLCDALEIPLDTFIQTQRRSTSLSAADQDAAFLYRRLNAHDRQVIDTLVASLLDAQQEKLRSRCMKEFVTLPRLALDRLKGNWKEEAKEVIHVRRSPLTERAGVVVTMSGAAMEKTYRDGDELYVEETEDLLLGEIGVFLVSGTYLVREYRGHLLRAHNPRIGDQIIAASDDVRFLGRVLGTVEKTDLPGERELDMLESIHWEKTHGGRGRPDTKNALP